MNNYAQTHIGLVREKNEDNYLVKEISDDSVLLMVADGMGGEAAGDVAAKIIRDTFDCIDTKSDDNKLQIINLIENANRSILDMVKQNSDFEGMGSTVTCAFVEKRVAHWAHVGDSRLYMVRNQKPVQITQDQNMAQFLIEEGEITAEEARHHPSRNHLDQCVGSKYCEPDTGTLLVEKGDLLVLTTDGLHGELSTEAMISRLSSPADIKTKAKSMIRAAIGAGGKDNITIVIAEM